MVEKTPQRDPWHLASAAFFGALVASGVGYLFWETAVADGRYGWYFFCGVPILMGFSGTVCLGVRRPATIREACLMAVYSYGLIALGMLIFAWEGIVCLLLASPIAIGFGIIGGLIGSALFNWVHRKFALRSTLCVLPMVPLVLGYGARQEPTPDVRLESTEIVIDAPPERIWPLLFNLDRVSGPLWGLFAAGVAYPVSTRSFGVNVGAGRECVLSTGTMHERISALDQNRRFRFDVLDTPPTMKETNPFHHIEPAHLRGYYHCRYGEFRLEPMTGGRTRLIGVSKYDQELYPAWYWGPLSDTVVEHVHLRVMEEIKRRAEGQQVWPRN